MNAKRYCLCWLTRPLLSRLASRSGALTGLFIRWSFETWPADYLTDIGEFLRQNAPETYERFFIEFYSDRFASISHLDNGFLCMDWISQPWLDFTKCRGLVEANDPDFRKKRLNPLSWDNWHSRAKATRCRLGVHSSHFLVHSIKGERFIQYDSWCVDYRPGKFIYAKAYDMTGLVPVS